MQEPRADTQKIEAEIRLIEPLSGGMVNSVYLAELQQGDSVRKVVVKISTNAGTNPFQREFLNLKFLKELNFPVPEPIYTGKLSLKGFTGEPFVLVEDYIDGRNMATVWLHRENKRVIQKEMAESVARLHLSKENPFTGEKFEKYGDPFSGDFSVSWHEFFSKKLINEIKITRNNGRLEKEYLDRAERIARDLDRLLKRKNSFPAPVHGDIWATNVILVQKNSLWHLGAFIDPSTLIADVEYELAYLLIFRTADEFFLTRYSQFIPIEEGFEFRKLIYWLHTMLVHVNFFGDAHYIKYSKNLIDSILSQL